MIEFQETERPEGFNQKEAYQKYKKTPKGREARRKSKSKQTEKEYLNRQFIAWDGEGVTDPNSGKHYYNFLANSMGGIIIQKSAIRKHSGLGTERIFEFLCSEGQKYPNSIHIIYGGGYDFNMFLQSMTRDEVEELYKNDSIIWRGYNVKWRRGRSFEIRNLTIRGSHSIIVYDVLPFFQTSFVSACDSYLGENFSHREIIVEEKKNRGTFTEQRFVDVRQYNDYELENLVALATELRSRLNNVGIRIKRWDGPGAIAAELLSKYNIQDAMAETPLEVAKAARYAYAGGRFEPIKLGVHNNKYWDEESSSNVYEYDINSAYPYAMQFLPNLRNGKWIHSTGSKVRPPKNDKVFALYHVKYREPEDSLSNAIEGLRHPRPFFKRLANGRIFFAESVEGWFWSPEVCAGLEYAKRYDCTIELLECWTFHEYTNTSRPFSFVPELYKERQRLKAAGDGANVGIKLGLNSLYGKLAQQIGWRMDPYTGQLRKPPFHQLEWAGYITAMCRSRIFSAAMDNLESVVAYETDALFVTEPLEHLRISNDLGDWEPTVFSSLSYIQSGFYFGTVNGKEIIRSRGVDKDSIDRESFEFAFIEFGSVTARSSRFITAGQALFQKWDDWASWKTDPRRVSSFNADTKRVHWFCYCRACTEFNDGKISFGRNKDGSIIPFDENQGKIILPPVFHETIVGFDAGIHAEDFNYEYPVEWIQNSGTEEARKEINEGRMMDYEQMSLFDENGAF